MVHFEELKDGRRFLREHLGRPTVYLDCWALYDIAACDRFRQRFVSSMNTLGGTLRVSASNLVELHKRDAPEAIDRIHAFLDEIDVGFINCNFRKVIAHEDSVADGRVVMNPSQEFTLIEAYLAAMNWRANWSVTDVIRHEWVNRNEDTGFDNYEGLAQRMNDYLRGLRSDPCAMEKSKTRSARNRQKAPLFCTPTRELCALLFDFVIQNKGMKMPGKEWHDVFHTVVPVAYCDVVFLDSRWASFVAQCGLAPPEIAFVYSRSGLEDGIARIAAWNSDDDSSRR